MYNLGLAFGSAVLTFTVTNIDAFCLLVLFFAKAKIEEGSTSTNVCIGQAIGFSIIVGVSLLGLALSASIDPKYVSLLGVVPIMMSLRSMYYDWDWELIKNYVCCRPAASSSDKLEGSESDGVDLGIELAAIDIEAGSPSPACSHSEACADDGDAEAIPPGPDDDPHPSPADGTCSCSNDCNKDCNKDCNNEAMDSLETDTDIDLTSSTQATGLEVTDSQHTGHSPSRPPAHHTRHHYEDLHELLDLNGELIDPDNDCCSVRSDETVAERELKHFLKRFFPAQIVEVAVVAVSNGGDNIATYLPFFAACSTTELLITVGVYYLMLVVWLVAAYYLLGDRRVIGCLHRYGHYFVPVCLIATGVYILSESILFTL